MVVLEDAGGPSRNRTGVYGFAVRCVTTPPSGHTGHFGSSRLLNEKRAEHNALMRTGVHSAAAEQFPPMGNRSRAVSSCSGWNGLIST